MSGYNKQEAKKIIMIAERSIRIVRKVLEDQTVQDIIAKEGSEQRGLVHYYYKKLRK